MNIRERLTDTFGTRITKSATDAPDFLYYWGFDSDTDEIVFHYGYLNVIEKRWKVDFSDPVNSLKDICERIGPDTDQNELYDSVFLFLKMTAKFELLEELRNIINEYDTTEEN